MKSAQRNGCTARSRWIVALTILASIGAGLDIPGSARAATNPSPLPADDLLRRPAIHRAIGTERIAVIVCLVPNDTTDPLYASFARQRRLDVHLSPARAAELANAHVTPYFQALSRGRYVPTFHAQGAIRLASDEGPRSCFERARDAKGAEYSTFLAIDNSQYLGGLGSAGISPYVLGADLPALDITNRGRGVYVGGGVFAASRYAVAWHEIGHALHWPHSHTNPNNHYDNPVDLMGGNYDLPLAMNVLAAGWMDDDEVAQHRSGRTVLTVSPLMSRGTQVVVIRNPNDRFDVLTVEHRPRVFGSDPGVAIHRIEQDAVGCGFRGTEPCLSTERRQSPALGRSGSLDHVLRVGQSATVDGVTIGVIGRTNDGFVVCVFGTYSP